MSLIRVIILLLLIYLTQKIFKNLFQPKTNRSQVKGTSQSPSLDLSNKEVEDVDFKELPK